MKLPLSFSAIVLMACASAPPLKANPADCPALPAKTDAFDPAARDPLAALDLVSDLAAANCHRQAIELGQAVRDSFREKHYSFAAEVFSIFAPEDALSEYVLESFERAFLSFIIATSYLKIGEKEEAAVELRRSYREGLALLYNYGEDPVNTLLIAALWERLGHPDDARPFWKKLETMLADDDPVHALASARIASLDRGSAEPWRILGLGRFPELDWSFSSGKNSYFELRPKGDVAHSCRSPTGAVLNTRAWLEKIAYRYAPDYHPLLNFKSWIRLPVGIVYGLGALSAGLGVAVGGCALDGAITGQHTNQHPLCEASIKAGGRLMADATSLTRYALGPDLRHWRRLPAAILITMARDEREDPCLRSQTEAVQLDRQIFVE